MCACTWQRLKPSATVTGKSRQSQQGRQSAGRRGLYHVLAGGLSLGGCLKGGFNPGLHVCCMTDCLSICICSSSLPFPSACTPSSLSPSFAWKQGKGSGRERITYGWLNQHLATNHITSKHRVRHSTAWHGKEQQSSHNNRQLQLMSRQQAENWLGCWFSGLSMLIKVFCKVSLTREMTDHSHAKSFILQIRSTRKLFNHQKQCRK